MFKQAKRGSLVECFRLNSINLGVLKLEDLKVGKIYMLFESRNAWHSTWITQYSAERILNSSFFFDLSSAKLAAEDKRVQGSVFAIEALPCLTGTLDNGLKFCIIKVNQNEPFINYANYIIHSKPHLYYGMQFQIFIRDLMRFDNRFDAYLLKPVESEITDSNFNELHNIQNTNWLEFYRSKAVGVDCFLKWHVGEKSKSLQIKYLIQLSQKFHGTKIIFDLYDGKLNPDSSINIEEILEVAKLILNDPIEQQTKDCVIAFLETLLLKNSNNISILKVLFEIYMQPNELHNLEIAENYLNQLNIATSDNLDQISVAELYIRNNYIDKAIIKLKAVSSNDKNYIEAILKIAEIYQFILKNNTKAIHFYIIAHENNHLPSTVKLLNLLLENQQNLD